MASCGDFSSTSDKRLTERRTPRKPCKEAAIDSRFIRRLSSQGVPSSLRYYFGTALLERVGVSLSRVLRYDPSIAPPRPRRALTFAVACGSGDLRISDLTALRGYGEELPHLYERYFEANEKCVLGRTGTGQLACVSWIASAGQHPVFPNKTSVAIWKAFTLPAHRGKGYHAQNFTFAGRFAATCFPGAVIYAECSAFNEASLKGIRKAGFEDCGSVLEIGRWKHYRVSRTETPPTDE